MSPKTKLSAVLTILITSTVSRAEEIETTAVKCFNAEYVRFSLSDGTKERHRLFSSVPCKYTEPLFEGWKAAISTKAEDDDSKWDVFRFRSDEKPGSPGFSKFDYLGESVILSPRAIGVVLTKNMLKEFESGKLYLENTPASLRHAIMVLKKNKPSSDVVELSKNTKLMQEYMRIHLVLYAAPENTGPGVTPAEPVGR